MTRAVSRKEVLLLLEPRDRRSPPNWTSDSKGIIDVKPIQLPEILLEAGTEG